MKVSLFLLPPFLVAAQERPLGTGARLFDPRYSGNGCPQGSANLTISDTGEWVTVNYSKFRTYIGPSYSPLQKVRNCQVQLRIIAPISQDRPSPQGVQGVQFAIAGSEYEGYYSQLDEGITAIHHSTYYSNDLDTYTVSTIARFDGGEMWKAPGRSYNDSREIPRSSQAYTYCTRPGANMSVFNANERIAMNSSNPEGFGISFAGEAEELIYTRRIKLS
ncbi:hypothetical protein QBC36DRAFT_197696 [Triangularia setosa]|uniref:Uncharacterized protein n=1 Tax=Triangularia setosa TaxID=2587417 RepID=A0AAN6VYJ2_9PEZI|nr:hypothetical protein QBC36DRAFT_197696 [Podospora setosa]